MTTPLVRPTRPGSGSRRSPYTATLASTFAGGSTTDDNAIGCDGDVAAVVLSHRELPYQYPTRLGPFFEELESCGVMRHQLLSLVQAVARHNSEQAPLLVVIGTPMRGTKAGQRHQHLAIWHVSDQDTRRLRSSPLETSDANGTQEDPDELPVALSRWAETARIDWCPVDEARPEVTRPRDGNSPVTEFADAASLCWDAAPSAAT